MRCGCDCPVTAALLKLSLSVATVILAPPPVHVQEQVVNPEIVVRAEGRDAQSWSTWQRAVVDVIRRQFDGALAGTDLKDVDWESWRRYYEQGRSAPAAVSSAFLIEL
jgi:hypothetical protein